MTNHSGRPSTVIAARRPRCRTPKRALSAQGESDETEEQRHIQGDKVPGAGCREPQKGGEGRDQPEPVKSELAEKEPPEQRVSQEAEARDEAREHEPGSKPPEHFVGKVRKRHHASPGKEQWPGPEQGLQISCSDAHAPTEFVTDLRRRGLVGPGRRDEDHLAARVQSHEHRNQEVVHDGSAGEWPISLSVEGINSAVGPEHGAKVRLKRFEPRLIPPVPRIEIPRCGIRLEPETPHDGTRGRMAPQPPHELPHGFRVKEGVCVCKDRDLPPRFGNEVVEHAGFPSALLKGDETDALGFILLNDCACPIGGSVRPHEDLKAVPGVVDIQEVPHALGDDLPLVVGGDNDADLGPLGRLPVPAGARARDLAQQPEEPWVPYVGVEQERQGSEREQGIHSLTPRGQHRC